MRWMGENLTTRPNLTSALEVARRPAAPINAIEPHATPSHPHSVLREHDEGADPRWNGDLQETARRLTASAP